MGGTENNLLGLEHVEVIFLVLKETLYYKHKSAPQHRCSLISDVSQANILSALFLEKGYGLPKSGTGYFPCYFPSGDLIGVFLIVTNRFIAFY